MPFIKADQQDEMQKLEEMLKNPERKIQYELFEKEYQLKQALVQARKDRKITQQELSRKTGLSQQAISRIESVTDAKGFTFRTLFKYLDGIGYELSIHKSLGKQD